MTGKRGFVVFGQPLIEEPDIDEVVASLRAAWPGPGPKVRRFETLVSRYKGAKHAVAVSSATAGLHLSLLALRLQPGDEVITTPLTFCATVNAIIHAGGTPVLADIDRRSMNIDPAEIRRKIGPRTRALLLVHLAGRPCDMKEIMALAQEYGLRVVEDCAHAIETMYRGCHAGTIGDCGVLSFYSTKNVSTGEGGMILTNNDRIAEWTKTMSQHGVSDNAWQRFSSGRYKHYEVIEAGFNYNMTDLQAALGIHQMERVARYWRRRKEVWSRYDQGLSSLPVELPVARIANPARLASLHHTYRPSQVRRKPGRSDRTATPAKYRRRSALPADRGSSVLSGTIWMESGAMARDAEKVSRQTISLPLSAKLSDGDVENVINAVHKALGISRKKAMTASVR